MLSDSRKRRTSSWVLTEIRLLCVYHGWIVGRKMYGSSLREEEKEEASLPKLIPEEVELELDCVVLDAAAELIEKWAPARRNPRPVGRLKE